MSECHCLRRFRVKEYEMLQRIESILEPLAEDEDDFELLLHVRERMQEEHDYLELNDCYCEDE